MSLRSLHVGVMLALLAAPEVGAQAAAPAEQAPPPEPEPQPQPEPVKQAKPAPPPEPVATPNRDADIALRATSKPPPHLIGRRVGPIRVALYAARSSAIKHWRQVEAGEIFKAID